MLWAASAFCGSVTAGMSGSEGAVLGSVGSVSEGFVSGSVGSVGGSIGFVGSVLPSWEAARLAMTV